MMNCVGREKPEAHLEVKTVKNQDCGYELAGYHECGHETYWRTLQHFSDTVPQECRDESPEPETTMTATTTRSKFYTIGFEHGAESGRDCKVDGTYSYDLAGLESWDAWLINGVGFEKVEELMECSQDSQEWAERLADYTAGAMAGYVAEGE